MTFDFLASETTQQVSKCVCEWCASACCYNQYKTHLCSHFCVYLVPFALHALFCFLSAENNTLGTSVLYGIYYQSSHIDSHFHMTY